VRWLSRSRGPSQSRFPLPTTWLPPLIVGILAIALWDIAVRVTNTPPYLLPGPGLVVQTLIEEWPSLFPSMLVTVQITVVAFVMAVVSGLLIAVLFTQSKWIERSFFPYAVILQTTPIVAIAPLIIIWFQNNTFMALVTCAWIVAFFPIVSNTTLGLKSADHNLQNLFQLYGASHWQTLWQLRLPSALPYFLGGLRISGGLALIGAVVAEFVIGRAGTGLGLAIVKHAMARHRGGVIVESTPGKGSAFGIWLPAAEPSDRSIASPSGSAVELSPPVLETIDPR